MRASEGASRAAAESVVEWGPVLVELAWLRRVPQSGARPAARFAEPPGPELARAWGQEPVPVPELGTELAPELELERREEEPAPRQSGRARAQVPPPDLERTPAPVRAASVPAPRSRRRSPQGRRARSCATSASRSTPATGRRLPIPAACCATTRRRPDRVGRLAVHGFRGRRRARARLRLFSGHRGCMTSRLRLPSQGAVHRRRWRG